MSQIHVYLPNKFSKSIFMETKPQRNFIILHSYFILNYTIRWQKVFEHHCTYYIYIYIG